jgi:glycerol kinase
MERYLLSIDQGTTNTKGLVVGRDGHPAFRASDATGLALRHPQTGFVEQDPEAIWTSVVCVVEQCAEWLGTRGEFAGICISNQRETALAWERATGRPVAPAMNWQCRRSEPVCERLTGRSETLKSRSGLPLDPLLSAGKWAWLLEQNGSLPARARSGEICFGTVDSWLIWKLTGGAVHACDHTNASRTGLLNLETAKWDECLLAMFDVPAIALPELRSSSAGFGHCTAVKVLEGLPIVAAIGDSHAALVGHGNTDAGTVKATYGTGSSLMTLTPGVRARECLASTIAWSVNGSVQYALEGNISMAGSAVQWAGEFLGLREPLAETLALAASEADSGGVSFVPAMVGLGAPHWNTRARGVICGLEADSRAGHLARAAIESTAFQVRDVFDAMEKAAGVPLPALRADGGATRNGWLMQFQADILGRPVLRSACEDLSALGAAWLGGLTLGWWNSTSEFAFLPDAPTEFFPQMSNAERTQRFAAWSAAVQRTLLETHT